MRNWSRGSPQAWRCPQAVDRAFSPEPLSVVRKTSDLDRESISVLVGTYAQLVQGLSAGLALSPSSRSRFLPGASFSGSQNFRSRSRVHFRFSRDLCAIGPGALRRLGVVPKQSIALSPRSLFQWFAKLRI